jgi:formate hydrogenlyase transcriptional activator
MSALVHYPWPGNIREMQNVIERAVILSRGPVLHIPSADLKSRVPDGGEMNGFATLEEVERRHILSVLEQTNWVFAGPNGAAVRLGIKRPTLQFSYEKARDYPSTTFNSCKNPGTIDIVPTGWQSANESASLVLP